MKIVQRRILLPKLLLQSRNLSLQLSNPVFKIANLRFKLCKFAVLFNPTHTSRCHRGVPTATIYITRIVVIILHHGTLIWYYSTALKRLRHRSPILVIFSVYTWYTQSSHYLTPQRRVPGSVAWPHTCWRAYPTWWTAMHAQRWASITTDVSTSEHRESPLEFIKDVGGQILKSRGW